MAQTPERRRRWPKRPALYLAILAVSAALSLGAAWTAANPSRGHHVQGG